MRRLAFLTLAVSLLFAACADQESSSSDEDSGNGREGRLVVPEAGENMRLSGPDSDGEEPTPEVGREQQSSVNVPLGDDELLVDVIDENLARDEFEEQIVAYKNSEDPDDHIYVRVIQTNIAQGGYQVTWQAQTAATRLRSLNISAEDVFGDGEPEIVVLGVDADGNQTLDIFRRNPGTSELTYSSVASLTSEGSLELVRHERDSEDDSIDPYDILAQSEDPEADNILDVVETTYSWDEDAQEFVEASREEISGGDIAEAQLQQLYQGGSEEFGEFLTGLWYREDNAGLQLVTFNPDSEQIVFNGQDMQETFDWEVSRKTISSGVQISMRNRNIRSLNTFVRVEVPELDRITVDVNNRERWDGSYRRVSDEMRQSLTGFSDRHVELLEESLDGTFEDDSGTRLDFLGNRFELHEDGEDHEGTFALYNVGTPILEMAIINSRGQRTDRRVYTYELDVNELDDRIIRSLELAPAELTVEGGKRSPGDALRLEQVEMLEEDEDTDEEMAGQVGR